MAKFISKYSTLCNHELELKGRRKKVKVIISQQLFVKIPTLLQRSSFEGEAQELS